jgi:hypothetical protein
MYTLTNAELVVTGAIAFLFLFGVIAHAKWREHRQHTDLTERRP